MTTFRIGDATIDAVPEGHRTFWEPRDLLPDASPEIIGLHRGWLEPHSVEPASGALITTHRSYLVRAGGLVILVDTCIGNDKERPLRPNWHRQRWPWMDNLRARGVTPEDVDIVMCTHLHTDHVGWNTQLRDGRWVPTFPNARYLFHETEYAYWLERHPAEEWLRDAFIDSVLPVVEAGRAVMVAGDHEVADGLWLEPAPGHTPGAVCLNLCDGDGRAVFCGDLMHHPVQVPAPHWSSVFCTDPGLSRATRTAFVERHAETGTMVLPAHFAKDGGGYIEGGGPGGSAVFRFAS